MNIFFDLDGVLLDTERPALNIWRQYIPENKVISLWERCLGISIEDEFHYFQSELGWTKKDYDEFLKNIKIIPQLKDGVLEVLDILKDYTLTLVTSSSQSSTNKKLEHCNLTSYFSHIITSDMVTFSKPNSQPYELAIQLTNDMQALVIEDSPSGIISAYNAGLRNIIFCEDTIKCPRNLVDKVKIVIEDIKQIYPEVNFLKTNKN